MAFYIAVLAHALVPVALILALWPATIPGSGGRRWIRLLPALWIGLAAGGLFALFAALRAGETAVDTGLRSAVFILLALALPILLSRILSGGRADPGSLAKRIAIGGFEQLWIAALAALGAFEVWSLSANHSLTSTDVINTELIVNCAGIATGFALLAFLTPIAARVADLAGVRISAFLLCTAILLLLTLNSAEILLGLLRLDLVQVTPARISYVAQLTHARSWLVHLLLVLLLILAAAAFVRRFHAEKTSDRVERRRQRAQILSQTRWRRALAAAVVILAAITAYQDLYASRPPSLSPALPVTPDEKGDIRFPIAEVKDGGLHRFAFVTSDGHRVRFFLINRYDEAHAAIGVVYDACMICGDKGYVQRGEEIICIACNVRIFRPSIGKPGGCNPIPLHHRVEDDVIVISTQDLEKGARYFSEVVEIEVRDPVTGAALLNTKAPFQFDYGGYSYFFSGKDSYETFRADPERYIGKKESRYFRVQGHKDMEG